MASMEEIVLGNLAGAADGERLLVVLCNTSGEGSSIELRQQSWGEGIGWFTQSKVQLQPHQVADLRSVLGGSSSRPLPRRFSQVSGAASFPRVVHADTA